MTMNRTMTDEEWQRAAEALGVTDSDAGDYKQAIADAQRLGIDAFGDAVLTEHAKLLAECKATGANPPEDALRRLNVRRTVHRELVDFINRDTLANIDAPKP
jgi:hypothetical protein